MVAALIAIFKQSNNIIVNSQNLIQASRKNEINMNRAGKDTASLADSFGKLYGDLPQDITNLPSCSGSSNSDGGKNNRSFAPKAKSSIAKNIPLEVVTEKSDVVDFLKRHLPPSDQKEIKPELKKTFALHKQKGGKIKKPQPKRKGKYLTAHERRILGLNRLPKVGGLKYADFSDLNNMWEDYMRDILGWTSKCKNEPPQMGHKNKTSPRSMVNVGDEQFRMRICRADFHGAFVKVTKSRSVQHLGIQGYVAMETRNTMQLLTEEDKVKMIPKAGSSFSFCLDKHLFTVGGSNFCMKPSERAVKKWKNRPPYDL